MIRIIWPFPKPTQPPDRYEGSSVNMGKGGTLHDEKMRKDSAPFEKKIKRFVKRVSKRWNMTIWRKMRAL